MSEPLPLAVRTAKPEDMNYILSSWKMSLREAFPMASPTDYYAWAKKTIDPLAAESDILVAKPREDFGPEDLIVGWSATRADHLLYVYVRKRFRGKGVTNLLVPEDVCTDRWSSLAFYGIDLG